LDVLARQTADLIERRQTELVDQRLAAIVGSTHDLDLERGLERHHRRESRAELFGYTAADVIGKSITVVIPTDRHNEDQRYLAIKRGERVDHYETIRLRKDGTLVDISLTVSPIKDASGNVVGASRIGATLPSANKQKHQELLTQEIHHRTKNIFSVVQAVVSRSFADKRTVGKRAGRPQSPSLLAQRTSC
jgi:PAS domain-containing protein